MGGREGGVGYPRDSSKETEWGKQEERKKKEDTAYPPLILSEASVTAAEACLLVLPFSWVDVWTLSNP